MGTERKEKKRKFGEEVMWVEERWGGKEDSVSVKLVAEMEEKAGRLTGEATGGSEGEVGGNQ